MKKRFIKLQQILGHWHVFFFHIPSLFLDLKEKQIPDLQIKAMYTFQRLRTNC